MSIITNVFTDRRERARAIGVWGAALGISLAIGPILGGLLTEKIGWRSIFWINVPIGVLGIVLTALFIPESRAPRARRIDPVGQVLVIAVPRHADLRDHRPPLRRAGLRIARSRFSSQPLRAWLP